MRERDKETVKTPEKLNRGSGKVSENAHSECVCMCACVCECLPVCVVVEERKGPILCL